MSVYLYFIQHIKSNWQAMNIDVYNGRKPFVEKLKTVHAIIKVSDGKEFIVFYHENCSELSNKLREIEEAGNIEGYYRAKFYRGKIGEGKYNAIRS